MITKTFDILASIFNLSWLTGPIFDKELRVSSRRRRNYVSRFVYLTLLMIIIALVWAETVRFSGNALYQSARMAEAGMIIIATIIWFQFCVVQFLAVIMLSNSISDEIYHKTLGTLMSTPITSFQIVIGKLASKLLQLLLYMAISLPLLAIVRVFGGVPWDFIVNSICITLTAVLFVGSLSLFYSIFFRRAYVVMIVTLLTLGLIFFVVPFCIGLAFHRQLSESESLPLLFLWNPYGLLSFETVLMVEPFARNAWMGLSTLKHCGIMLAGTAVLLGVSMAMVRKVALSQAIGLLGSGKALRRKPPKNSGIDPDAYAGRIRTIKGSPILWKELRSTLFGKRKVTGIIVTVLAIAALIGTYCLFAAENNLHDDEVHLLYAMILGGIGLLFTIILPATSITSEKESQNWILLMATPLSSREILMGKVVGILRRTLPAWILLFGHIILFSLFFCYIHWIAIIQLLVIVAWIVLFLTGTGIYFSTIFKRTTAAVVANFGLALTLWAIIPLILGLFSVITRDSGDVIEGYVTANPVVQVIVAVDGGMRTSDDYNYYYRNRTMARDFSDLPHYSKIRYSWPHGPEDFDDTSWIFFWTAALHFIIGLVFAWRAECRFRKVIF